MAARPPRRPPHHAPAALAPPPALAPRGPPDVRGGAAPRAGAQALGLRRAPLHGRAHLAAPRARAALHRRLRLRLAALASQGARPRRHALPDAARARQRPQPGVGPHGPPHRRRAEYHLRQALSDGWRLGGGLRGRTHRRPPRGLPLPPAALAPRHPHRALLPARPHLHRRAPLAVGHRHALRPAAPPPRRPHRAGCGRRQAVCRETQRHLRRRHLLRRRRWR
eukprot:1625525-Prymnesium_polylepis.1